MCVCERERENVDVDDCDGAIGQEFGGGRGCGGARWEWGRMVGLSTTSLGWFEGYFVAGGEYFVSKGEKRRRGGWKTTDFDEGMVEWDK